MKYMMLVMLLLLAPTVGFAASVIDPVGEAACTVIVTPTSGDRFKIETVEARLSYVTSSECEQDLLEFDVLPGDIVTIDDVSNNNNVDRYRIPFSVGATSNSSSASPLLHYYGEAAEEDLVANTVTGITTTSHSGAALSARERETLKITIMTHMITVMQRIIFLFGQL